MRSASRRFAQYLASPDNKTPTHVPSLEYYLARSVYQTPENRVEYLRQQGIEATPVLNKEEFMGALVNGQLYNVHRGSVTREDWVVTDTELALGRLEKSARYQRALEDALDAQQAAGQRSIEVGHSLGGTLATTVAQHLGNQSVTFNQGSTPLRQETVDTTRHRHYRTEGDPISQFDPNATVVQPTPLRNIAVTAIFENTVPGVGGLILPTLFNVATQHTLSAFQP